MTGFEFLMQLARRALEGLVVYVPTAWDEPIICYKIDEELWWAAHRAMDRMDTLADFFRD